MPLFENWYLDMLGVSKDGKGTSGSSLTSNQVLGMGTGMCTLPLGWEQISGDVLIRCAYQVH